MYTQMIEHCTGAGKTYDYSILGESFNPSISVRTNGENDGSYVRILVRVYYIMQHSPSNEDSGRGHDDVGGLYSIENCECFGFNEKRI